MSDFFALHRSWLRPSGTECCVFADLTGPGHRNLVVARERTLEVYSFVPKSDERASLQLRAEFPLHGVVRSVERVPLHGKVARAVADGLSHIDAIAVTFGDAKVSILGYDPVTRGLRTLAMRNFEEGAIGPGSGVAAVRNTYSLTGISARCEARVDPQGRCMAMIVYNDQLAVMPLRTEEVSGDWDEGDEEGLATLMANIGMGTDAPGAERDDPSGDQGAFGLPDRVREVDRSTHALMRTPYVVPLARVGRSVRGTVHDCVFLPGYVEPTVAILHERLPTPSNALAFRQHTNALTVVSVEMHHQHHPVIWSLDRLPHDAHTVLPVPGPVGGVVILSDNAILCAQPNRRVGVALNGYARATVDATSYPLSWDFASLGVHLAGAVGTWLGPSRLLLTLQSGAVLVVTLRVAGVREIRGLHISTTDIVVFPPSCVACVGGQWVFQGSRVGDSMLLSLELGPSSTAPDPKRLHSAPAEQGKEGTEGAEDDEMDEEDKLLYGTQVSGGAGGPSADEAASSHKLEVKVKVHLHDVLHSFAPLAGLALGDVPLSETERQLYPSVNQSLPEELVAVSGMDRSGALCRIHRGVRPTLLGSLPLQGCSDMFFVRSLSNEQQQQSQEEEEGEDGEEDEAPGFLLLSFADRTRVLASEDSLRELPVSESLFRMDLPTIAAGALLHGHVLVQVVSDGVRFVHGALDRAATATMAAPPGGERIVRADCTGDSVLVVCDSGTAWILHCVSHGPHDHNAMRIPVAGSDDAVTATWRQVVSNGTPQPVRTASLFVDTDGALGRAIHRDSTWRDYLCQRIESAAARSSSLTHPASTKGNRSVGERPETEGDHIDTEGSINPHSMEDVDMADDEGDVGPGRLEEDEGRAAPLKEATPDAGSAVSDEDSDDEDRAIYGGLEEPSTHESRSTTKEGVGEQGGDGGGSKPEELPGLSFDADALPGISNEGLPGLEDGTGGDTSLPGLGGSAAPGDGTSEVEAPRTTVSGTTGGTGLAEFDPYAADAGTGGDVAGAGGEGREEVEAVAWVAPQTGGQLGMDEEEEMQGAGDDEEDDAMDAEAVRLLGSSALEDQDAQAGESALPWSAGTREDSERHAVEGTGDKEGSSRGDERKRGIVRSRQEMETAAAPGEVRSATQERMRDDDDGSIQENLETKEETLDRNARPALPQRKVQKDLFCRHPSETATISKGDTYAVLTDAVGRVSVHHVASGEWVWSSSEAGQAPSSLRRDCDLPESASQQEAGAESSDISDCRLLSIGSQKVALALGFRQGGLSVYLLHSSTPDASAVESLVAHASGSVSRGITSRLCHASMWQMRFTRWPFDALLERPPAPGTQAPKLVPFDDIRGWRGAMWLGPQPAVILPHRGVVRVTPLSLIETGGGKASQTGSSAPPSGSSSGCVLDSHPVAAFCALDTPDCERGFVLSMRQRGQVLFATLPSPESVSLRAELPVSRNVWRETPTKIAFLGTRDVPAECLDDEDDEDEDDGEVKRGRKVHVPWYGVGIRRWKQRDPEEEARSEAERLAKLGGEHAQQPFGPHIDMIDPVPGTEIPVPEESHSIALVNGRSLTPVFEFPLDRYERLLSLRSFQLAPAIGAPAERLLVATTGILTPRGEDEPSKGRVLVLRMFVGRRMHSAGIVRIDAKRAEQASVLPQLSLLAFESLDGASTAAAVVQAQLSRTSPPKDFLAVNAASRMVFFDWNQGALRRITDYEGKVFALDVVAIKNFVLLGDVSEPMQFLRWNMSPDGSGEPQWLKSSPTHLMTAALEFLVHEKLLGLVAADADGNLQIFQYRREAGRMPLHSQADFHLGALTTALLRKPLTPVVGGRRLTGRAAASYVRHGLFVATSGGGLDVVCTVNERTFHQLKRVQEKVTLILPRMAGLNPAGFRLYRTSQPAVRPPSKRVLDGSLLWELWDQRKELRQDLAEVVGTTFALVAENLWDTDMSWNVT